MTLVALVTTALWVLTIALWRHAETENARLREEIDALAGHLQMAADDADAIMAARLDAHNETAVNRYVRDTNHPTFGAFGRQK